jgi:hypothetical protein
MFHTSILVAELSFSMSADGAHAANPVLGWWLVHVTADLVQFFGILIF